jgi:cytochrome P450
MTALHVHNNEAIFPNHKKFSPERWLNQPMYEGRQLERYMLAFGRGTRQCLGMKWDALPLDSIGIYTDKLK